MDDDIVSWDSGRRARNTHKAFNKRDNGTEGREGALSSGPEDTVADGSGTGNTEDHLMTSEEVASYLRVSRSMVYKMISQGALPFKKVGTRIRVDKQDLLEAISVRPGSSR